MRFFSDFRKSPNRKVLLTSLSAKAGIRAICRVSCLLIPVAVIAVCTALTDHLLALPAFAATALGLCILVCHIYSFTEILSHPDSNTFVQAKLCKVWTLSGRIYCHVSLTDPQGKELIVRTYSIPPVDGWESEAYLGRTAALAYNTVTGKAVIIALLPN